MDDPSRFFVHFDSDIKSLKKIEDSLDDLNSGATLNHPLKRGQLLAAMSSDGSWYRARIERVNKENYQTYLVDWGKHETITFDNTRKLPTELL